MKRTVMSRKEFFEMINTGEVIKRTDGGNGFQHKKCNPDKKTGKYYLPMNEGMVVAILKDERHEVDVNDRNNYDEESGFFIPEWIFVDSDDKEEKSDKLEKGLISLLKDVLGEDKAKEIDEHSDKFINAYSAFSKAVDTFNEELEKIPQSFKETIDFACVIRVDYAGEDAVTLINGKKKNLIHILADVGRKILGVKS